MWWWWFTCTCPGVPKNVLLYTKKCTCRTCPHRCKRWKQNRSPIEIRPLWRISPPKGAYLYTFWWNKVYTYLYALSLFFASRLKTFQPRICNTPFLLAFPALCSLYQQCLSFSVHTPCQLMMKNTTLMGEMQLPLRRSALAVETPLKWSWIQANQRCSLT